MSNNAFDKGCLIQVSSRMWGATRKIQSAHVEKMGAGSEWLNANKKLVDPKALRPLSNVVCNAKNYLAKVSLPFPIQAMVFVPKEMINSIDYNLNQYKGEFDDAVETFKAAYPYLRENAIIHLGELFNESDYPVDVSSRFSFSWRFLTLNVPNGNTRLLAPEVYEREKQKFVETMDEARQMGIEALRIEFAGYVKKLTDRLNTNPDGKPRIFKNGTVNNFYDFFETFKQRNIFEDQGLKELVTQAQAVLSNQTADAIRSDKDLKNSISQEMNAIEINLDELLSAPRRRIVMD